jgi:hypothetical protein
MRQSRAVTLLVVVFLSLPALTSGQTSHVPELQVRATTPSLAAPPEKPVAEETVTFNTKSLKYHCQTCSAAKRCTVNCIDIPVSKAIRRGGVACKLCGGSCR